MQESSEDRVKAAGKQRAGGGRHVKTGQLAAIKVMDVTEQQRCEREVRRQQEREQRRREQEEKRRVEELERRRKEEEERRRAEEEKRRVEREQEYIRRQLEEEQRHLEILQQQLLHEQAMLLEYKWREMEEQRQAERLQRQLQQEQAYLLSLQHDHRQQQDRNKQQQQPYQPAELKPQPHEQAERAREADERFRKTIQGSPQSQSKQPSKVLEPSVPSRSESFSNGNSEPAPSAMHRPMEPQVPVRTTSRSPVLSRRDSPLQGSGQPSNQAGQRNSTRQVDIIGFEPIRPDALRQDPTRKGSVVNVNPTNTRPQSDTPEIRKYKKRFNSEILCAALWGVNLLVGTESGLMLLDRSGQGKVYPLIGRRRFQQMDVLEGLNVLVTISGKKNKLRVYYLSWLRNKILHNDPEVEKKQGWTTVGDLEGCVHYNVAYIRSNQIMGWGEKAIEIRSVETGHLDGVFMHKRAQRLKFLCERNDKVFFASVRSDQCQQLEQGGGPLYTIQGEAVVLKCPSPEFLNLNLAADHGFSLNWVYEKDKPDEGRVEAQGDLLWFLPALVTDSGDYVCILRNASYCVETTLSVKVYEGKSNNLGNIAYPNMAHSSVDKIICPDLDEFVKTTGTVELKWYKDLAALAKELRAVEDPRPPHKVTDYSSSSEESGTTDEEDDDLEQEGADESTSGPEDSRATLSKLSNGDAESVKTMIVHDDVESDPAMTPSKDGTLIVRESAGDKKRPSHPESNGFAGRIHLLPDLIQQSHSSSSTSSPSSSQPTPSMSPQTPQDKLTANETQSVSSTLQKHKSSSSFTPFIDPRLLQISPSSGMTLTSVGVNLLVGTESGLMLLDRSGQGKVYPLIGRRRFQQMDVLEGLNVLVTISGKKNKLRVYYLSWLRNKILRNDPEVEKKQGWTTVGDLEGCVHYNVVKYERIKFLVIALKNSVEVYAWAPKPYHKFMAFKIQSSIQPHAVIILPNTDGIELLVCYEDEGVYVNTYGRITKDVVLQWGEMPTSVAYIRSNQIMGWGEKAIEIRSVETGHLDGVFMHKRAQRLKFLCERNDKVGAF
ncbi:UNVERIFIED_CONTAM: hypothetical protein FKN15_043114 [Acipenser sinensis]